MLLKNCICLGIFIFLFQINSAQIGGKRLVCYYDTASAKTKVAVKPTLDSLQKALPHCTHLVFASAHLDAKTFQILLRSFTLKPKILKNQFPHLKIYLSLGGDSDDNDKVDALKYIRLLQTDKLHQQKFIKNSIEILKSYGFDGLDLAFPLPRNKPREVKSLVMIWNEVSNKMWGDKKDGQLKALYSDLLCDLRQAYDKEKLALTMTVLPNVNSTMFFDISKIQEHFEFINLFAFDFHTAERCPHEADYSAPLYHNPEQNRLQHANVDFQINHWLSNGCPAVKLNLGIATYGRAWRLTIQSGLSGQPIVSDTAGAGGFSNSSQPTGLLSWTEICYHLPPSRRRGIPLRSISDQYGNYAFRVADSSNQNGIWISYDDPEFAVIKTQYSKRKALGGIALFDLRHDDFKGYCRSLEYPILQSVRKTLGIAVTAPRQKTFADILKEFKWPQKT